MSDIDFMLMLTGTFARVWLVRLANPRPEDRDKVFALKVLRKVDGANLNAGFYVHESALMSGSGKTQTG